MLDILGFWFSVTIISALMLMPIAIVALFLLAVLINEIVQDDKVSDSVIDKMASYSERQDTWTLFGIVKVPGFFIIVGCILAAIFWTISVLRYLKEDLTVVQTISSAAEFVTPVTSYVSVVVLGWLFVVFTGRKLYKLGVRVNAVLDKVEDK